VSRAFQIGADVPDGELEAYPLYQGETLDGSWTALYHDRLLGSDFVALHDLRDIGAATLLWAEAARQAPAGTLPTDRRALAQLVRLGRDLDAWAEVEAGALYGWRPCFVVDAEGVEPPKRRLMHPVVQEVVQEAVDRITAAKEKKARNSQRARLSFLRKQMERAGLTAAQIARPGFAELLRDRLEDIGEAWEVPTVRREAEALTALLPDDPSLVAFPVRN